MRHAKRIAKDLSADKDRPVLKGVLHFPNGDLAATNSHVLYLGRGIHDKELQENTVITPEGKTLDLKYPEVGRLLPTDEANFIETIDVDEFIKAVDLIHVAGRVSRQGTVMKIEGDTLTSKVDNIKASYTVSVEIPKEIKFSSNAEYWLNALRMLKNLGYKEATFNFNGAFRPFTLVSPDDKITALILPVRSY